MHLYLVRHGDYLADDPKKSLSLKGRQETEQMASFLAHQNLAIRQILHSPKTRAKETAAILAKMLSHGQLQERQDLSPDASCEIFAVEVNRLIENTLIVSHLPFLTNLIRHLLYQNKSDPHIAISSSGIISLMREDNLWTLEWLLTPELTRQYPVREHLG